MWLKVLEIIDKLYDLIKKNATTILTLILFFKDRKIQDQKKIIERLEEENKTTFDNVKKKETDDKKTSEVQKKMNSIPKPKKLLVLFLFLFCSCTTTKIITRTEYIKPTLPDFNFCSDTELVSEPLQYQADCSLYYEAQIRIYNEWKLQFLSSK